MNKNAEVALSVPFHDLDPLQMVWHGNYLKYFDIARFALLTECGLDLQEYYVRTGYIFPLIKTATKFIEPLRYKDDFLCRATVSEARIKIVMDFEIRLAGNGRMCAKGRGEQVAVKLPENEMMLKIPDDICIAFGFEP